METPNQTIPLAEGNRRGSRKRARQNILRHLEQGHTRASACRAADVPRRSFYYWLTEDPHFREQVRIAEQASYEEAALLARRCAFKADTDPRYLKALFRFLDRNRPDTEYENERYGRERQEAFEDVVRKEWEARRDADELPLRHQPTWSGYQPDPAELWNFAATLTEEGYTLPEFDDGYDDEDAPAPSPTQPSQPTENTIATEETVESVQDVQVCTYAGDGHVESADLAPVPYPDESSVATTPPDEAPLPKGAPTMDGAQPTHHRHPSRRRTPRNKKGGP